MAIKSQRTQMYVIDPGTGANPTPSVLTVGCVTSIDGIDTSVDQVETTCLEEGARTYMSGLATPGSASFGIQFDPADASHVRLHELKVSGDTLEWAVGFSDGTSAPTLATDSDGNDVFDLPADRSWISFAGFMNSYPFTFALNAVVESTVGIQISGEPSVVPKV